MKTTDNGSSGEETPKTSSPTTKISIPIIRRIKYKDSGLVVHRFPENPEPENKPLEIESEVGMNAYVFYQSMAELLQSEGEAELIEASLALIVQAPVDGRGKRYTVSATAKDPLMWRSYIDYLDRSGYHSMMSSIINNEGSVEDLLNTNDDDSED